jgi:hypothetical protein
MGDAFLKACRAGMNEPDARSAARVIITGVVNRLAELSA